MCAEIDRAENSTARSAKGGWGQHAAETSAVSSQQMAVAQVAVTAVAASQHNGSRRHYWLPGSSFNRLVMHTPHTSASGTPMTNDQRETRAPTH
jgi:hypothetical protein